MVAPLLTGDAAQDAQSLMLWMTDVEQRLDTLTTPRGPTLMFSIASTSLTVASAAQNNGRQVFLTDLKCPGCSDGVHWYRADTGALIV